MVTRHFFTSRYATLLLSIHLPQAFVAPRFTLVAWDNSLAEVYTELKFTILAEVYTELKFTLSWGLHRAEVYSELKFTPSRSLHRAVYNEAEITLTLSWSLQWAEIYTYTELLRFRAEVYTELSWNLQWAEVYTTFDRTCNKNNWIMAFHVCHDQQQISTSHQISNTGSKSRSRAVLLLQFWSW